MFHGLQVFQRVPEEVYSYWHRELGAQTEGIGAFRIEDSSWLASFSKRHLGQHTHFVLEWYDDVVEVICRELVFGKGDFDIADVLPREPRLGNAYFRHALAQEKLGRWASAIESWERYLACAPHVASLDYAARSLAALREKSQRDA